MCIRDRRNPGVPAHRVASAGLFELEPLPDANFGAQLRFLLKGNGDLATTVTALKADPEG